MEAEHRKNVEHELAHVIGFAIGLRKVAVERSMDFMALLSETECFLELTPGDGVAAHTAIRKDKRLPTDMVMAHGALAPVALVDAKALRLTARYKDLDHVFSHDCLSPEDRAAFDAHPLTVDDVLGVLVTVTDYVERSGRAWTKHLNALWAAKRAHQIYTLDELIHHDRLQASCRALPAAREALIKENTSWIDRRPSAR